MEEEDKTSPNKSTPAEEENFVEKLKENNVVDNGGIAPATAALPQKSTTTTTTSTTFKKGHRRARSMPLHHHADKHSRDQRQHAANEVYFYNLVGLVNGKFISRFNTRRMVIQTRGESCDTVTFLCPHNPQMRTTKRLVANRKAAQINRILMLSKYWKMTAILRFFFGI
jgi:hypothetical protein